MSVTYGFYNALNHDRRYDAIQMSSIFDGIVRDGIFMSIGDCMVVKEEDGMLITVGIGRAWFNHTWTLNDALLPLEVPQSEVILNRIDAVVLEVNAEQAVRANTIKIVKGTPASNPARPTLINTATVHQYPLAYISVRAGVTSIRQANITNMVGTSATPYVTGILDTVNIDNLIAQWKDQWQEFFENQTEDMENTNQFWKDTWNQYFADQSARWEDYYQTHTAEINAAFQSWVEQWQQFYGAEIAEIEATKEFWARQWSQFYEEETNAMLTTHAYWANQWQALYDQYVATLQAAFNQWSSAWSTFYDQQTKEISDENSKWKDQWAQYFADETSEMDATAQQWRDTWYAWYTQYTTSNQTEWQTWLSQVKNEWKTWFDGLHDDLTPSQAASLADAIEALKKRADTLEECCHSLITEQTIYQTIDDSDDDPILDSDGEPIMGRIMFVIK